METRAGNKIWKYIATDTYLLSNHQDGNRLLARSDFSPPLHSIVKLHSQIQPITGRYLIYCNMQPPRSWSQELFRDFLTFSTDRSLRISLPCHLVLVKLNASEGKKKITAFVSDWQTNSEELPVIPELPNNSVRTLRLKFQQRQKCELLSREVSNHTAGNIPQVSKGWLFHRKTQILKKERLGFLNIQY